MSDESTLEPIKNAKITINIRNKATKNEKIKVIDSNSQGQFEIDIGKGWFIEGVDYEI